MEFRPLKIKPPSPERTTRMHLFTALLPPGVLEYCIESPEKIALELNNFFSLPYKKNHPTGYYLIFLRMREKKGGNGT